ncbi:MAG: protein kinase [Chloroflexota bacterium]
MAVITNAPAQIIGKRYKLLDQLGAGGMGSVFRATDRLSGDRVALKRVLAPTEHLIFSSYTTSAADLRLLLAQEFQTLASLHHPNIIGVLDFGFDEDRQPYFTMDLLNDVMSISQASSDQPLEVQIAFLAQVLRALEYLHRRGILHRDLKPGNILVQNGQVKVLDFGLSIKAGQGKDSLGTAGTLAYIAPELLEGNPSTIASDLYAVGMIAYEVLAGHHPFNTDNLSQLINQIVSVSPDVESIGLDDGLTTILARLLAKHPDDRFPNAADVIAALNEASPQSLPAETSATRESFLQAARLVGRDAELAQLSSVLAEAIDGEGSVWLIGGESGIGKSRLIDELSTLALVRGVSVARGQAISEGGGLYYIWRPILRWLCLSVELSDLEAGVLKPLIPDLEALLDRSIPDAPPLGPHATQDRLFSEIEDIFRRHDGSLMVILEDLHWATEDLELLGRLQRIVENLPILFVGTYRDDEQPDIPHKLPGAGTLKLTPLSNESIAQLSESMLGPGGGQPAVIDLLTRETEGNIFFLVEVVRALAEEAGQLDQIGKTTLPQRVFAGGIQNIVRRRLSRTPEKARPLLQAAAVLGRELDTDVLHVLDPNMDLEQWLTDCANAAVLTVLDGHWRFAHDKLRDGLLRELSPERSKELHRQAAEAILTVYPDAPAHYAMLAYHWNVAGNEDMERKYAALAGDYAMTTGAHHDAITFLERAMVLLGQDPDSRAQRGHLERLLSEAYSALGDLTAGKTHARQALILLGYPEPRTTVGLIGNIMRLMVGQAAYRFLPHRSGQNSQASDAIKLDATVAYERLAEAYYFDNATIPTAHSGLWTLNLAMEVSVATPELARASATSAMTFGLITMHPIARAYFRQAQRIARELKHLQSLCWVLVLDGVYHDGVAQWEPAVAALQEAIDTSRQIGDWQRLVEATLGMAWVRYYHGEFAQSAELMHDITVAARRSRSQQAVAWGLVGEAIAPMPIGYLEETDKLAAMDIDALLGEDRAMKIYAYGGLAPYYLKCDEPERALEAVRQVKTLISGSLPTTHYSLMGYAGAANAILALYEYSDVADQATLRQLAYQMSRALHNFALIFPVAQPYAWRVQGVYSWLAGNLPKAHKAWAKALHHAQRLNIPYEEGLTHYEIGRHLDLQDAARQSHLTAACEIFQRLGVTDDLARAQAALESKPD